MHDNGKQFTSTYSDISLYTIISRISEYQIAIALQGKVEAYNKIVKNEFIAIEDMPNINDGKLRYDIFVKTYNETREHGGINGLTPSKMFLQRINYIHST